MTTELDDQPAALVVTLNGDERRIAPGSTVLSILQSTGSSSSGIAVARNGEIVPRSAWADVILTSGDRIELVGVAPGG